MKQFYRHTHVRSVCEGKVERGKNGSQNNETKKLAQLAHECLKGAPQSPQVPPFRTLHNSSSVCVYWQRSAESHGCWQCINAREYGAD